MARFFHVVSHIICPDLITAFDAFWRLGTLNLHCTNDAYLTLLPKYEEALPIKDYCHISLIHIVGKLLTKVLANTLAPRMENLILPSQGAFLYG
jgi:hypothetical protein